MSLPSLSMPLRRYPSQAPVVTLKHQATPPYPTLISWSDPEHMPYGSWPPGAAFVVGKPLRYGVRISVEGIYLGTIITDRNEMMLTDPERGCLYMVQVWAEFNPAFGGPVVRSQYSLRETWIA